MDLSTKSRKEVGAFGEAVAAEYVRRRGMRVVDRNIARKTGELDLIALEEGGVGDGSTRLTTGTLHFIEVKTVVAEDFPSSAKATEGRPHDQYDPSVNLHAAKVRKVARTAEWYVMEKDWEGEWQVDGCLVWLRRRDGRAKVTYLPQIV